MKSGAPSCGSTLPTATPSAGSDAYWTPAEATYSLLALELVPHCVWEPAAGSGAIVRVLEKAGHTVIASDIVDYGAGYQLNDYLTAAPPLGIEGEVTNPPFRLAEAFARKALTEVPYVALLLRMNFLESTRRLPFFRAHPPARVWISSRRLPMMHRFGWTGPEASSNHCFAWFVWDRGAERTGQLGWFDWQEFLHLTGSNSTCEKISAPRRCTPREPVTTPATMVGAGHHKKEDQS